jgi:hypothetical protein
MAGTMPSPVLWANADPEKINRHAINENTDNFMILLLSIIISPVT